MKRALTFTALTAAVALGTVGAGARAAGRACPASNRPNKIIVSDGSGQTTQLGKQFPTLLRVALANTNGCPLTGSLAGYNINFDAPGSGPSGFFAGSGSREAVVGTDAQGTATAPAFTANFTAGSYTVDAHSDFGTVEFNLSNTAAGLAAAITAGTGTPQQAKVNSQYTQPLQARVTDANGNPVQGANVTFSIVNGPTGAGASFLGGVQSAAMTDSNGVATSLPLLANGTPGKFSAVASTDGVSTVATFSLDNNAATQTLTPGSGAAKATTVDTRYPQPLTARLLDASGQPLEGAQVTFTLGAAGGGAGSSPTAGASFLDGSSVATVLTDQNGQATSPPFVANGTPGDFTVTATSAGATGPIRYRLQNLPAHLNGRASVQHTPVSTRYRHRLVARVTDQRGRPIDAAAVSFTIGKAANGATATFPDGSAQATVTTDKNGRAVAPTLEATTLAGSFSVVAAMSGGTPIRFTLDNRAGAPATIAAGAASGEQVAPGSRFPLRLAVTVTDKDGNQIAGQAVTFVAPRRGAGCWFLVGHARVRRVTVKADSHGVAIAPPVVANGEQGGYVVTATAGRAHAGFALLNEAS